MLNAYDFIAGDISLSIVYIIIYKFIYINAFWNLKFIAILLLFISIHFIFLQNDMWIY